jgi:hypothetical protein
LHPNPQSAIRNPQSPITDSPWFWVLAFSLMALLALVAIGGKYGRRQTRLELQYQARERIAERRAGANNPAATERTDDETSEREFAAPGSNLIPLWPLAAILFITAALSAYMLRRGRLSPSAARLSSPKSVEPGRSGSLGGDAFSK